MAWKQLLSFLSTDTFAGKGTDLATVINNLTSDTQAIGGNLDGSGYLLANLGGMVLLAGDLPGTAYTVTAGSWAGGTATLTIGAHNIIARQQVQVAGVTPSGYNGSPSFEVSSVTGTTVSYALSSNPGTWTSGGTVTVGATVPASGLSVLDPTYSLRTYNGSSFVFPGAPTGLPAIAYASGTLTLTTTPTDITGTTLTTTAVGTYLILVAADITMIGAGDASVSLVVDIVVNGSTLTNPKVIFAAVSSGQRSVSCTNTITSVGSGQVVKLQGWKSGGTGTSTIGGIHTSVAIIRVG